MESLTDKTCKPCEGGIRPLTEDQAKQLLRQISGWEITDKKNTIGRKFNFKNFYQTIAFVNAVAWIANQENHHPDLSISYNHCLVQYRTHAINGLSENDFICAAKINKLISK